MNKGFTLIELLLVIAIIGIISITSPVFYSRFLLQNAVANTTDQLAGSLRKAQLYSMMGKSNSGWAVNFSANTITVYKGAPPFASRAEPGLDEKFSVNSNVSISCPSCTSGTDVAFAKRIGLPTPNSGLTFTISSGNNSKQITVNSQGVASK